jgi:hypothetical protein
MKNKFLVSGIVLISAMLGCSSNPPVTLKPMGPSPAGVKRTDTGGGLQVFSFLEAESDNPSQGSTLDPLWYQHTGYDIYTPNGQYLEHVDNTLGHYAQTPPVVILQPGKYIVEAHAVGYLPIRAQVTIESRRITMLHLDGRWTPPRGYSTNMFVLLPNGNVAGWSTNQSK